MDYQTPHTATDTRQAQGCAAPLTVITAEKPARLSKRFTLTADGLEKQPGGSLVRGECERSITGGPESLALLLELLEPNQALCYGVPAVGAAPVASRREHEANPRPGEITRTRDNFDWPAGPGWLLVDYDPQGDETPMDSAGLLEHIAAAWPQASDAPAVTGASGSSYIYNAETGEQLKGAGGLRRYVLVADGRDIPRAGQVLFDRLWLAGYGFYVVSKSGALLERASIDASVWQPERLDFAAGASCADPLEQRRPPFESHNPNAAPIDTRATLPDLTADEMEQLKRIKAEQREALEPERQAAQAEWVDARMEQWGAAHPDADDEQREQARERLTGAVTNGQLFGDFQLLHSGGEWVPVGALLDDPQRWHGERFADPLEPDYANDPRIAWLNLRSGGRPYLWSHAHGGQRFRLVRASASIKTGAGEMPRIIREADQLMRHAGEVYQRGGELVRVMDEGAIHPVTGPWLRTHLETIAHWLRFDMKQKAWLVTDAPGELHARILHNRGAWSVPELTAVIRGPIIRPDGTLADTPGYDPATGLLMIADHPDGWPAVPMRPGAEQVKRALAALWEPFEHFPFVDGVSRAVHLAAILTAVQRPVLETAPAFAWNAYKAGSGKSKAAKAVAWLSGQEPTESPWSTEPEEQRKRLMASLMAGPGSMLLDNISGPMESDALCSILTAARYQDRRLGQSEEVSAPTRVLITATGNNLRLVGDLSRRVLVSTVDHGVESPERLAFPFDPVQRVRERWPYYRAAALTVLRGFLAAGSPCNGSGQVGNYEQWDALVRQCVCWLDAEGLAPFELADPADAVAQNYEADPETQKLRALLAAWRRQTNDGEALKTGELIRRADTFAQSDESGAAQLGEVLEEIAGERGKVNSRRLGRWIEKNAGRILDGYAIKSAGQYQGQQRWKVVESN